MPRYPCEAHTSAAAVAQRPAAIDLEDSSGISLVFVLASRPPRSRHQQMLLLGAGARHQLLGRGRIPPKLWFALRMERLVQGGELQTALNTLRCAVFCTELQGSSAQHSSVSAGRSLMSS